MAKYQPSHDFLRNTMVRQSVIGIWAVWVPSSKNVAFVGTKARIKYNKRRIQPNNKATRKTLALTIYMKKTEARLKQIEKFL